MGLEVNGGERRLDGLAEGFEPVLVPAIGVGCPVLFAPVQELINDHDDKLLGIGLGTSQAGDSSPLLHQAVIRLECCVFVGAKIDLLPIELDIPATAGRAERTDCESVPLKTSKVTVRAGSRFAKGLVQLTLAGPFSFTLRIADHRV